jgi:transcriptional regulator with XRE-family HTH domain
VPDQELFFRRLGQRIKELRRKHGYSQEDMIGFGFSARHFQQLEAGRPMTVTTLLRICEVLDVSLTQLLRGLDEGVYERLGS